jgi:hypothetical protein
LILHGLIADFQPLGDFLVPEALGDQGYNFPLTRAKGDDAGIDSGAGRGFQTRRKLSHHRSHGVGIEPDLPRVDLANAFKKKLGAGLLEDDATGAQLHRLHKLGLVLRRGHYNDPGLRRGVAQLS